MNNHLLTKKYMTKLLLTIIAVAVIVGGSSFYGGIKYTENKGPARQFSGENFQNLSPQERQQRFQELGANVSGVFGGDHQDGGGFRGGRPSFRADGFRSLIGEIISQNEDNITIKLSDGSTKIVFISESTQITKTVNGILGDLTKGEQIFVSGAENSDGSYTAQTIQLRSE